MRKNLILIPDKFINQSNLIQFNSFELKLLFNSFKKQRQDFKKSEEKKIDTFITKLNGVEFIQIKKEANNHILINIDPDYRNIKNGSHFSRYTPLNIDIINKLKKKKAILLYIFVQKELKKPDKQQAKALNVPKSKLVKFTDYRNLTTLDTLIAEINAVNNRQSVMYEYDNKNKSFLLILEDLITKTTHKRSLIDDAEKELTKVSDEKLEKMFLDIATEIIKRNGGGNGVNAVGMLKDIKKETVKDNDVKHLDINKTLNDVNLLIIQEQNNLLALEGITAEIEKLNQRAKTAKAKKNSHRYYMAKLIFENQKQPTEESKKVLDYLKQQHKQTGKQTLKFNIFDLAKELGYSTDDEGVKALSYIMLQLVNNRYADIEIIDDTILSYDLTPNFEKAKKAEERAKAIEKEEAEKEAELNRKDKDWAEKYPIIVTEDMLPDFTPDTTEYETLDARAV